MHPLSRAIGDAVVTFQSLAELQPAVDRAAELIGAALTSGKKLLVAGNGGSAADGADFATEFACRFITDRAPYPAINLAACGSLLTATGNDYGFEEIFARGVRAFGSTGDVFLGITTSGNSANIIAALRAARDRGMQTIALLGRDGGNARGLAEVELIVAGAETARIQEAHKFLLHVICGIVETDWLLKA
jgi:D-sedoheptulose 7-phosphate isomerase